MITHKIPGELLESATRTTNGSSSTLLCDDTDHIDVIVSVTAKAGTTPALNIKAQTRERSTDTWMDIPLGALSEITTDGAYYLPIDNGILNYFKLYYTIAGASASFTFSIRTLKRNIF